jgi:hypothetical protein
VDATSPSRSAHVHWSWSAHPRRRRSSASIHGRRAAQPAHFCEDLEPTTDLDAILNEIDEDPTCIFFG